MAELRPVTPVAIVAHDLRALAERVDRDGWGDGARAELDRLAELAGGLDPYLEAMTSPASADLDRLAARTVEADWSGGDGPRLEPEMLSGHVEGRFLAFLVRATRARAVLEVGMFTGYSALAMAEALPDGGRLVALELDERVAAFAREAFDDAPHGGRIEVRVGPAGESLAALAAEGARFDLVFVDADKGGYGAYLDALLDGGLLAPGGVVCVDNTLLQGRPWAAAEGERGENGEAIAEFNRRVADDDRLEQVLVPLRDGVTLIRRVDD